MGEAGASIRQSVVPSGKHRGYLRSAAAGPPAASRQERKESICMVMNLVNNAR